MANMNKSPELETALREMFPEQFARIDNKVCPFCAKPITEFRDAISEREYDISGLCQDCQDKVFSDD